ncbi:MAG: dienelactone hydrolase family protein [Bdellovibrionales bacterium]|nr:dienelactone hydrolase family protein [Bdellovibrionales bacterium]
MKFLPLVVTLLICLVPRISLADANEHSIIVDGRERAYLLFAPPRPQRLMLVLHGGGGNKERMAKTRIHESAMRQGYAVVYPDAVSSHWNDGRKDPNVPGWKERPDDINFLRLLIAQIESDLKLTSGKVYVTGPSNGGMMTFRVGCELSDKLSAIAPVIASMPEDFVAQCRPVKRLPVLMINGKDDPLVPYEGGQVTVFRKKRGLVVSAEKSLMFWSKHNHCSQDRETQQLAKKFPKDSASVELTRYKGCDGADVSMYAVNGGGHRWFGNSQGPERRWARWFMGETTKELDTNDAVLKFFNQY